MGIGGVRRRKEGKGKMEVVLRALAVGSQGKGGSGGYVGAVYKTSPEARRCSFLLELPPLYIA